MACGRLQITSREPNVENISIKNVQNARLMGGWWRVTQSEGLTWLFEQSFSSQLLFAVRMIGYTGLNTVQTTRGHQISIIRSDGGGQRGGATIILHCFQQ